MSLESASVPRGDRAEHAHVEEMVRSDAALHLFAVTVQDDRGERARRLEEAVLGLRFGGEPAGLVGRDPGVARSSPPRELALGQPGRDPCCSQRCAELHGHVVLRDVTLGCAKSIICRRSTR
jgi:hypothetical protein